MAIYNSQSEYYKKPFGAVKQNEKTCFTLRVPAYYYCQTPYLFIYKDGDEAEQIALEKQAVQADLDTDVFSVEVTLQETGLYFYWFDLWTGYRKLYKGDFGEAVETTETGTPYSLTVYSPTFTTPQSVHGSVMYQIFPDRFFEGNPEKKAVYNDRVYRTDKEKEPYYWPLEQKDGYLTKDFYGGDLAGIEKRLPFLQSLGVEWVYLTPIFEAHSNHRYDTADYLNVDPYLGTNEDFTRLTKAAKEFGIKIILDGVFSHTGSDSIYFNREGRYSSNGAWQGPSSPYRDWYKFNPDGSYESWWGFTTLPTCDKSSQSFRDFICGEGGVIDTWLQRGASGFRLDVADELPDDFIVEIRKAIKRNGEENLLIGEVWEDASLKEAYGERRKYFLGQELDSVMNYPFRTAILAFLNDFDSCKFANNVLSVVENYPLPAMSAALNHISTHDTVRAITQLAGDPLDGHDRDWQSGRMLTPQQYQLGIVAMRLAFVLQFTLPGIPCVYYGDEIAMQGYKDPFNRGYYNWNSGETSLMELMVELAKLRKECPAFQQGSLHFKVASGGVLLYERKGDGAQAAIGINCSGWPVELELLGEKVSVPHMEYAVRTEKIKA